MEGLRVKVDFEAVKRQLNVLGAVLRNPRAVLRAVADWMLGAARESFQEERSPEGQAWAALSLRYAERKAKIRPGRNILQFTGTLSRTVAAGATNQAAFVESTLPYAGIHQYGGRAGRGGTARIPARPYLPGAELTEREGKQIVEDELQQQINKSR